MSKYSCALALSAGLLAVSVLYAPSTFAADKLAVLTFDGPKKEQLRDRVSDALLRADYELVELKKLKETDEAELAEAAKPEQLTGFVDAAAQMSNKQWTLNVSVRDSGGKLLEEFAIKAAWLPGLLKEIDSEVPGKVKAALAKAAPSTDASADATGEAAAPAVDEAAAAKLEVSTPGASGKGPSPLFLALQVGGVMRNWKPKDAIFNQLLAQEDAGMLSARVNLGVYPVAFFKGGTLADLGLIGRYEMSFGAKTEVPSSIVVGGANTADMSHSDMSLALHYRVHAGAHQLGFSGGAGKQSLDLGIDAASASLFIPDVKYSYMRFGFDTTLNFGKLSLGFDVAYRPVSSIGDEIGQVGHVDWFPKGEADGSEVALKLGYGLSDRLSIVVTGDYRAYGFNFHRKPADQQTPQPIAGGAVPVAGGASDTYLGAWAGVMYRMPGSE